MFLRFLRVLLAQLTQTMGTRLKLSLNSEIDLEHFYSSFGQSLKGKLGFFLKFRMFLLALL